MKHTVKDSTAAVSRFRSKLNVDLKLLPGFIGCHKLGRFTRLLFKVLVWFSLVVNTGIAHAGPWVDSGDGQLRHHLQVLADAGVITVPITTYPLMWSGIARDLDNSKMQTLSESQAWSLSHVRHELSRQRSAFTKDSRVSLQTSPSINGFAAQAREQQEANVNLSWLTDHLAVNVSATVASDEIDNQEYRLDGSYLAGVVGNWAVAAGAIDRWWGPGWQNSLILSDVARPVPGISLQRNYSDASTLPILNWFGPWQLVAFAGQLERDRHVDSAKLLGLRITFKPWSNLEIGVSRTAQWGGEGRPESLSSFTDAFIGNDNRGDDGINADNEPGNQLAGIDARLSFSIAGLPTAVYGQAIGEDSANSLPSRTVLLAGMEASFSSKNLQSRVYVEASSTEASQGSQANYAYEHGIYRSGYRYRGRPLAAALDNDTQTVTLAGDHYTAHGHQVSWSLMGVDLNRDGTNRATPGGNSFGDEPKRFYRAEAHYKHRINAKTRATVGVTYLSEDIKWRGVDEKIQSGIQLAIERKW